MGPARAMVLSCVLFDRRRGGSRTCDNLSLFLKSQKRNNIWEGCRMLTAARIIPECVCLFARRETLLWSQKRKVLNSAPNPYIFDRNEDRGEPNMAHSVLCFGAAGEEAMRRDATESG